MKSFERAVIQEQMRRAIQTVEEDSAFEQYSAREKVLALYYTWVEEITPREEWFRLLFPQGRLSFILQDYTSGLAHIINPFIEGIIRQGTQTGEIASRSFFSQNAHKMGGVIAWGIMAYWIEDKSEQYGQTDAFIEKTVNFYFDILQPGALDSGIDFVRFLTQRTS